MNRAALRQELKDLGHNYGTTGWDARLDRFLNQGAKDILLGEPWPQRQTTSTVAVGATVPLLGSIRQVRATVTGVILDPSTEEEIRDAFPGPIPAGEPLYYYVVRNSQVLTWPSTAGAQIDVSHLARRVWVSVASADLVEATADTDTLVGGDVFEEAVLLAARLRVLEDTDENELRESLQLRLRGGAETGGVLGQLRDQHLQIVADEPPRIKQTRDWC